MWPMWRGPFAYGHATAERTLLMTPTLRGGGGRAISRCKDLPMADVRESLAVVAPADAVYDLVADLPRMGEWSPECERVIWRGGATSAAHGAQFLGSVSYTHLTLPTI